MPSFLMFLLGRIVDSIMRAPNRPHARIGRPVERLLECALCGVCAPQLTSSVSLTTEPTSGTTPQSRNAGR